MHQWDKTGHTPFGLADNEGEEVLIEMMKQQEKLNQGVTLCCGGRGLGLCCGNTCRENTSKKPGFQVFGQ